MREDTHSLNARKYTLQTDNFPHRLGLVPTVSIKPELLAPRRSCNGSRQAGQSVAALKLELAA